MSSAVKDLTRGNVYKQILTFAMPILLSMLGVWCVLRMIYIENVCRFSDDIRLICRASPITGLIGSVIDFLYYKRSDWVHGFDGKAEGTR